MPERLFDEAFLRRLEYLHVVARKLFAGQMRAERRSRKVGAGLEFADHRDYAAGDDPRYIDWNVYGRTDRLLLRLFEEEEDLHIHLLVDASRSMGFGAGAGGSKLDLGCRVAAALGYVGLANLDRVGATAFSAGLGPSLPAARGKARIFKLLNFLGGLRAGGETRLADSAAAFVHRAPRRGLCVVISDLYDPAGYADALNLLRYHRFEPLVCQVYDERDARPPLRGDLTLVDCETGDRRDVTVSGRVLDAYAREHARYLDEVAAFCAARRIPYVRAHTGVPFDEIVLRVFRLGGFLA